MIIRIIGVRYRFNIEGLIFYEDEAEDLEAKLNHERWQNWGDNWKRDQGACRDVRRQLLIGMGVSHKDRKRDQ